MEFRKHFDYDLDKASDDAGTYCEGESLTVQSMAEDADINVIMERYGITGKMPEDPRIPVFGDFTEVGDYRSALEAVMNANANFMDLPAKVRNRFNNDPQELLDFCADDANIEEARKLGLLKESSNEQSGTGAGAGGTATGSGKSPGGDSGKVSSKARGRGKAAGGGKETAGT